MAKCEKCNLTLIGTWVGGFVHHHCDPSAKCKECGKNFGEQFSYQTFYSPAKERGLCIACFKKQPDFPAIQKAHEEKLERINREYAEKEAKKEQKQNKALEKKICPECKKPGIGIVNDGKTIPFVELDPNFIDMPDDPHTNVPPKILPCPKCQKKLDKESKQYAKERAKKDKEAHDRYILGKQLDE